MLKKFEVSNYKNFKEKITLDFSQTGGYQFNQKCITEDVIGKMLIYGRNATGKTNLGRAILDITNVVIGMGFVRMHDGMFLNADSDKKYAEFRYIFKFGQDEIEYMYTKISENQLLYEELKINGKSAFNYEFDKKKGDFDLESLGADTAIVERFFESSASGIDNEMERNLSFLRWLINNTALEENSILLLLADYIRRMGMLAVGTSILRRPERANETFYELLEQEDNLKDFEKFLNIMGVECRLKLITLPEGQKELYFDHNKPVPFSETASSGTLSLANLYRRLMLGKKASLLYLDEFDAFYHYEMSEKVIDFFKEMYPKCQLILTTHNTNLMTNKLMRPDCLFILSRKGELTALNDATERELREGHNLEKLYISGEFGQYE